MSLFQFDSLSNHLSSIRKSLENLATKEDLRQMKEQIMTQVQTWAANEQVDLTNIAATLNNVAVGAAALKVLITNLQNSPGTLSAADQAALDGIQAASDALVIQANNISTTPPGTPVTPVVPVVPSPVVPSPVGQVVPATSVASPYVSSPSLVGGPNPNPTVVQSSNPTYVTSPTRIV